MDEEQKERFHTIFYEAGFQEFIANALLAKASAAERRLFWIFLVSVAAALVSGTATIFLGMKLEPLWAVINIGAIIAAIYGVARSPGERRFIHHDMARRVGTIAAQAKILKDYASKYANSPEAVDSLANDLQARLNDLFATLSVEHREHGHRHKQRLTNEFQAMLRYQGLIE